jgi:hypothetical protein
MNYKIFSSLSNLLIEAAIPIEKALQWDEAKEE